MRKVSPREAHELMRDEGFVYLDVRSVPEFDEGHPASAYNIPLAEPDEGGMRDNPDFVRQVLAAFPPNTKIVVGCATGVRSRDAAERLAASGYTAVVEQAAGMLGVRDAFGRLVSRGWRSEGLPVSNEAEPGHSFRDVLARVRTT
jgi:rhodanese-related sulfurtransferase